MESFDACQDVSSFDSYFFQNNNMPPQLNYVEDRVDQMETIFMKLKTQLSYYIDFNRDFLKNFQIHSLRNDFILLRQANFNTKQISHFLNVENQKQINPLIDMTDFVDNFYFLLERSRSENQYIKMTLNQKIVFLFPTYVAIELFDYFGGEDEFKKKSQNKKDDFSLDDALGELVDDFIKENTKEFQSWMNLLAFNVNKDKNCNDELPEWLICLLDYLLVKNDFFKNKIKK